MLAALGERIPLMLVLLLGVPATLHFIVVPLWRAHREHRSPPPASASRSRRTSVLWPLVLGALLGWGALPILPDTLFVGVLFGLMLVVIALGWYLLLSEGAFRFCAWHPFFGLGRPVPEKMAGAIHAPIALSILLLFAGGLLGLVLHMLWLSSRA